VQAHRRPVRLLEDGLEQQDVEVRRQLQRGAEALDEGHGAGERPSNAQPPGRPALEGEERPDEEAEHLGEEPGVPDNPWGHPLAWARGLDAGRVFYCALGHESSTWEDPRFQAMLADSIGWVLRRR
jgi:hypothetical protein